MKVLRAGIIYAIGNVASAAVPFALLPLLTRVLSPAEYGIVVAFGLVVTLCMPFSGLSVHAAVGVAWFKRPREEMPAFVGAALAIGIASTLLTAVVIYAALRLVSSAAFSFDALWGAIAAITAGANVLLQCRLALWQSQQRPVLNVTLQFMASTLNVALSLVAVLVLGWGGAGRNAGIAVSAGLMAACAVGLLLLSRDAIWSLRRDHIKALMLYGPPLIPHVLGGVLIGTADRWIVSTQLGAEMLGIYGAGAQLGMVMTILADAFIKAYSPWLFARLASTNPEDRYSAVGAIYVAMPVFLCTAVAVGAGLYFTSSLLLGAQYRAATVVLPWFMLGGAFIGMYFCVSNLFFFFGRTSLLSLVTSSSAVVGTLLISLLAARFGIEGAAMGYAATQGLLALTATVVASRHYDLPWGELRRSVAIWFRSTFFVATHQSVKA
jgi:O-antigen/teichoic acid export membrane protein